MTNEEWKEIPGYEGLYMVSDLGRVRSLPRSFFGVDKNGNTYKYARKGRILKPGTSLDGYNLVGLSKHGKCRTLRVHRLVMIAFRPLNKKETINHIDGCKTNNKLDNLEWATRKENMIHAKENGLLAVGERVSKGHLKESDILKIRKLRDAGKPIKEIGNLFKIDPSTVSKIALGRRWQHVL